jgi:type VI secretion system protein ImpK
MTPEFAKAVDPVFLYVLNLLERISQGESVSAEDQRSEILKGLDRADAQLGHRDDWQLAKYALVSWIDEVLIEAPWEERQWVKEHTLEWSEFKSQDCAELFYVRAREAGTLKQRDALEVFYLCVVLGFRGLYREPNQAAVLAEQYGLPPNLEAWAKSTAMAIQLGRGIPPLSESSVPIEGASPLTGPFTLIWAVAAAVILLVVGVIFLFGLGQS